MKLILTQDVPGLGAPGDVVEVSVPDLGTLRNTVADERSGGSPAGFPEPPKPR